MTQQWQVRKDELIVCSFATEREAKTYIRLLALVPGFVASRYTVCLA